MTETKDNSIERLQAAVAAMSACDRLTLSAALAILPDYMDGGTGVVLAAAARIIAERFADPAAATDQFRKAVMDNLQAIMESQGKEKEDTSNERQGNDQDIQEKG